MQRCPACGSIIPESYVWCACGFNLVVGTRTGPISHRRLLFHGTTATLYRVYFVNLLLTILTLGIYGPWARVKIRQYCYGQTELEGDRFAFHGTGEELLIGWLKLAPFVALFFGARIAKDAYWEGPIAEATFLAIFYGGLLLLMPIAIAGSWRYRLSRTSWRGIRFSFRGHTKDFMRVFVVGALLTVVSLGLYYPFFHSNIRRFIVSNSYFGNRRFEYDGKGSDLFGRYAIVLALPLLCLIIAVVSVLLVLSDRTALMSPSLVMVLIISIIISSLYWFWFAAARERYYWAHTSFGTARFQSIVTGRRLMNLKLANGLLLGITYGLALPYVQIRKIRFAYDNRSVEGPLDLRAIQQEAQAASATGEGMAEFLDTGFLDIDLGF